MRQGPLAGRYPAAAAMVMFALIPYLALSAAIGPVTPIIARQLHMSLQTMSLGSGMGNAAYAVGTVLAVQLAQLLPQRRMMVLYVVLLVIGSVLAAAAQDAAMFIAGHVLQGLCTSLLLIAAVPPLALGFGVEKLRCDGRDHEHVIFGAVALGPTVGGMQARPTRGGRCSGSSPASRPAALVLALLDLRGHSAGQPERSARRPSRSASRPPARSPPSTARLSCSPTSSSIRRRSGR